MAQDDRVLPVVRPGLPLSADYSEVSTATRLVGDRWSLLVVRELALGSGRFSDIHEALPGLSRGLLVSRLRYLERLGILERRESLTGDRRSPFTYALTPAGWGLVPVLTALGDWVRAWRLPGGSALDRVPDLLRYLAGSVDRAVVPNGRVSVQFHLAGSSDSDLYLRVDSRDVRACLGTAEQPDLVVRSSAQTLVDLYWGRRTCAQAVERRDITFDGPTAYAQQFPEWFPNRPAVTVRDAP